MKQPEALRLADEHDENGWIAGTRQWCTETAAELRRLHDVNQMLLDAITKLMDTESYWWQEVNEETIDRLKAAIEKAGEA